MEKKQNNKNLGELTEAGRVQNTDEMSEEEYFEYVKSQGYITLEESKRRFTKIMMEKLKEIHGGDCK